MTTKIEWTDRTWNPVTGCSWMSRGCNNCYALKQAKRLKAMGVKEYQHENPFDVTFHEDRLHQPRKWKPSRVFLCSMGDLFHKDVSLTDQLAVWTTMAECGQHVFQVLTKRPGRMKDLIDIVKVCDHVWIGTTVESPHEVHRAEVLKRIEAKVRFLSIEPMLEDPLIPDDWFPSFNQVIIGCEKVGGRVKRLPDGGIEGFWAVAKHIRKQCEHAGTAFFLKQ